MFHILLNIVGIIASFYAWSKLKDRKYFLLGSIGVVVLFFGIGSLFSEEMKRTEIMSILTVIYFISIGWYSWQKSQDKDYFWFSLLGVVLLLTNMLKYYVIPNTLHLPVQEWSDGSIIILVVQTAIFVALIKILVTHACKSE